MVFNQLRLKKIIVLAWCVLITLTTAALVTNEAKVEHVFDDLFCFFVFSELTLKNNDNVSFSCFFICFGVKIKAFENFLVTFYGGFYEGDEYIAGGCILF